MALGPRSRFSVYRNNVFASLIGAVAERKWRSGAYPQAHTSFYPF